MNIPAFLTYTSHMRYKRILDMRALFPLVSAEIPDFDIDRYLLFGGLPQVYPSKFPREELDAYINTYLHEELLEEGATRDLTTFSRFLRVAATVNAEQVNYSNVANDTGISASSVRTWFEILNDTFLGFLLEPWRGGLKRKTASTAKFYLFDVGVWNFLRGTTVLDRGSDTFGKAFEHWIAMELRRYLSYRRIKSSLTFWRTYTGLEVDFVIDRLFAVQVNANHPGQQKTRAGAAGIPGRSSGASTHPRLAGRS